MHVPVWVKGTKNHLAAESQAAYRAINLHFHDLRREFRLSRRRQSRSGWPPSARKSTSDSLQRHADAHSEKNSHTETECENSLPPTSEVSESAEVAKH